MELHHFLKQIKRFRRVRRTVMGRVTVSYSVKPLNQSVSIPIHKLSNCFTSICCHFVWHALNTTCARWSRGSFWHTFSSHISHLFLQFVISNVFHIAHFVYQPTVL